MTDYEITAADWRWLEKIYSYRPDGAGEASLWQPNGCVNDATLMAFSQWDGVEHTYFATQDGYNRLHSCTR